MIAPRDNSISSWPHWLAVALVCATFPLIWIGGLVTTYDAGMAVPDWPTTYGYNLFLYPWQTWIQGPWDLFIEHGHRLLGAVVGMLTIGLVISEWLADRRRAMRWLSVVALLAVIAQGILGGMRVRMDEVLLAQVHGCFGPAFFALTVALAIFTSRAWQQSEQAKPLEKGGAIRSLAFVTTGLAYLQLVIGSMLRHMPSGATPASFRTAAMFHILVAIGLFVHVVLLLVRVVRSAKDQKRLTRPAWALFALMVLQILLGVATWTMRYGWPTWLGTGDHLGGFVVAAESRQQAWVVTSHVATGSLILATSLAVSLWSLRLVRGPAGRDYFATRSLEVAL